MSTTRAEVLRALHDWGHPTIPNGLASIMERSALRVGDVLATLYRKGLISRYPLPGYECRFTYAAKATK